MRQGLPGLRRGSGVLGFLPDARAEYSRGFRALARRPEMRRSESAAWCGAAELRVARRALGARAVAACSSSSCGGRSSLSALGTGGSAGASGAMGGSTGTGGSSAGAGGLVTRGSAGTTIGTGGASATGGTGGSGGIPSRVEVCEDALRSLAEERDDGNRSSGYGCSIACRIEPGATCVEVAPARSRSAGRRDRSWWLEQ